METRDLIIIGAGPGGYTAAIRAAQLGMKTLVIEKSEPGGTCLNCGCIPTKIFYRQAELLRTLTHLADFNISIDHDSVRFDPAAAWDRKNKLIGQMRAGIAALLKSNKIELVFGSARITAPHRVEVVLNEGENSCQPVLFQAERILLATGSENRPLNVPGADLPEVLDSKDFLNLTSIPEELVIIGGGVIGVEFASIFNAFGAHVVLIEALENILPAADREVAKRLAVYLKKQGIEVLTSTFLKRMERLTENKVLVHCENKGKPLSRSADKVLIAVGRRPNLSGLGLEKLGMAELGLEMDGAFPKTDSDYQTSLKGLYVVGDLAGKMMLAHVAAEEGKIAVERMAGLDSSLDYNAVPSCVFSFPEVSSVGLTQEQATEKGIAVKTGKFLFAGNGKAQSLGEIDGFVKIIADTDETILGVHIIGPHASDLILEGSFLVRNRMKISEAIRTIHPHPTLGEVILEALLDVRKEAIHLRR